MYPNRTPNLLLALMLVVCFNSCEKEDEFFVEDTPALVEQQNRPDEITKLGEQLVNPYSVENMKKALNYMLEEVGTSKNQQARFFEQSASQMEIKETDLYVRFLPKDSLELNVLEKDSTLILYDHPLDYEIEEQGDYYHDPDLAEDQITWQYTVVKPDYTFPEVEYEILSNLFIPENSEGYREEPSHNGQAKQMFSGDVSLDKLETVSLYLTGNLPEDEKLQIENQKKKDIEAGRSCIWFICWKTPDSWNPSGTIKLWDDRLNDYYPMQGVRVRARRWFTTKTDITDSQGYFKTRSFKRPANYSIRWERHHFSIKWSWWLFWTTTAWYNGPKKKAPWNL
ncbi:MAG: hypothetical protein EBS74_09915, partial [Flavobacteriia bacterium]|nr:hypothetical protein [Flavobacteriia bacterium]